MHKLIFNYGQESVFFCSAPQISFALKSNTNNKSLNLNNLVHNMIDNSNPNSKYQNDVFELNNLVSESNKKFIQSIDQSIDQTIDQSIDQKANYYRHTNFVPIIEKLNPISSTEFATESTVESEDELIDLKFMITDYHVLTGLNILIDNMLNFKEIVLSFQHSEYGTITTHQSTINLNNIMFYNSFVEQIIFPTSNGYTLIKLPFAFSKNNSSTISSTISSTNSSTNLSTNLSFVLHQTDNSITLKLNSKSKNKFELYASVLAIDSEEIRRLDKLIAQQKMQIRPLDVVNLIKDLDKVDTYDTVQESVDLNKYEIVESQKSFEFDITNSKTTNLDCLLHMPIKELIWYYEINGKILQSNTSDNEPDCKSVVFNYSKKSLHDDIDITKTFSKLQLCIANHHILNGAMSFSNISNKINDLNSGAYYVLPFSLFPNKYQPSGEFINYGNCSITHNFTFPNQDKTNDSVDVIKVHLIAYGYDVKMKNNEPIN